MKNIEGELEKISIYIFAWVVSTGIFIGINEVINKFLLN